MKITVKAESARVGKHRFVFKAGDAAVQIFIGRVLCKFGSVLTHQRKQKGLRSMPIGERREQSHRVLAAGGKHQVPHNRAAHQKTCIVKAGCAGLSQHLAQCLCGYGEVIGRGGILCGKRGGVLLEIGQIDVHQSVKRAQGVKTFIAATVVDDGNAQRWLDLAQHGNQLCGIRGGCDQIDVVRTRVA